MIEFELESLKRGYPYSTATATHGDHALAYSIVETPALRPRVSSNSTESLTISSSLRQSRVPGHLGLEVEQNQKSL